MDKFFNIRQSGSTVRAEIMAGLSVGTKLDVLTGLGNGYDTSLSGDRPVLVGGGVGVPPMFNLCKKLIAEGKTPTVILGFGKADEVFYKDEFEALGLKVLVTTVDGSYGIKGFEPKAPLMESYSSANNSGSVIATAFSGGGLAEILDLKSLLESTASNIFC